MPPERPHTGDGCPRGALTQTHVTSTRAGQQLVNIAGPQGQQHSQWFSSAFPGAQRPPTSARPTGTLEKAKLKSARKGLGERDLPRRKAPPSPGLICKMP